jgi:hypothetical protein
MFLVKVGIIALLALLAIVLGGMAAAWRRACVAITRRVHTVNWTAGDGSGSERPAPPGPGQLSKEHIIRFTPAWVSLRHLLALAFLALAVVATLVLLRWYVALSVAVGTYTLMELSGFLFPRRDHPYYVWRLRSSFSMSLAIADRFGDEVRASEMRSRLRELTRAYADLLQPKESSSFPENMSRDRDSASAPQSTVHKER